MLADSEQSQTSKMERVAQIVMGKNSVALEIIWFFDDFRGRGVVEFNELTQDWLVLKANFC